MKCVGLALAAAILLGLFVTGCETNSTAARIREKPAVYAALEPWAKRYIDQGVVLTGFSPDMVYLSIGRPTSVEPVTLPNGKGELWTYRDYYPSAGASQMRFSDNTEQGALSYAGKNQSPKSNTDSSASRNGGPSIGTTGGPQGGSMEPADMKSFTLTILFRDGNVVRLGRQPN